MSKPNQIKVEILLQLDSDVYMALRAKADEAHIDYQMLINKILREKLEQK